MLQLYSLGSSDKQSGGATLAHQLKTVSDIANGINWDKKVLLV